MGDEKITLAKPFHCKILEEHMTVGVCIDRYVDASCRTWSRWAEKRGAPPIENSSCHRCPTGKHLRNQFSKS